MHNIIVFLIGVFFYIQTYFDFNDINKSDHVEISVVQLTETEWKIDLDIPSEGLNVLELRDMRHTHNNCGVIEYKLLDYNNAIYNDADSTTASMKFKPENQNPIHISYIVSAPENDQLSISSISGCSSISKIGDSYIIDGRALFLALRPLDFENNPYRFNETILTYTSEYGEPSYLSTGRYDGDNTWYVDRIDLLRFAFLLTGSWSIDYFETNEGDLSLTVGYTESNALDVEVLSSLIFRSFDSLSNRWGSARTDSYSVILTPPLYNSDSFGQQSGIANPQSIALYKGLGINSQRLLIPIVHEIAHHWMPTQLGMVREDTWIGEGLVELVTYIELLKFGYLEDAAVISRINRAISNLNSSDTTQQIVYDLGIVSWLIATEFTNSDLIEDRFDLLIELLREESEQALTAQRFWSHAELQLTESDYTNVDVLFSNLPCRLMVNSNEFILVEDVWPIYDTGLVLSSSEAGHIDEVVPGSAADKVGLSVGDRIYQVDSFGYGDIHNPLTVYYSRNSELGSVTFIPRSEQFSEIYPQYVPSAEAGNYEESSRCKAF